MAALLLTMITATTAHADNWDEVLQSTDYYKGVGRGKTAEEARQQALKELTENIVVHVKSSFDGLTDETHRAGTIEHSERVQSCVQSYSQSTLFNVQTMQRGAEPAIAVLAYMHKSEMQKVYKERIDRALSMVDIADGRLQQRHVDMALQYYYYAYSLVRSLPMPSEAKDQQGRLLVDLLPLRIRQVLSDVSVTLERRDGDNVDLLFTYQGQPVSTLDFTYNDGRNSGIDSRAKDGRGAMEMVSGHQSEYYHIDIRYDYSSQARGDQLMESVMGVTPHRAFPEAQHRIKAQDSATQPSKDMRKAQEQAGVKLSATKTQAPADTTPHAAIMARITHAIRQRQYTQVLDAFTPEGLHRFNSLISYGRGRIVGTPRIQFFRGLGGHVVARGLQMAFSFSQGTKKNFVEDVVFTIDSLGMIDNVTFGLGQVAENDILCKHPDWNEDTRELLMEFLENYKTAYCLKDYDYIKNVFADDAIIIVGNVVRKKTGGTPAGERPVTLEGQETIKYNRYDKDGYLHKLRQTFKQNEMINLRFSQNDIQMLDKYKNEEIFGITIGQEYNSTHYADKGYLFLLVNMTNHDEPQIKIRTWQPNEVDMSKVFNSGYFYE